MTTTTIDLKPFCEKERYGRYDLATPFRSGEWIVATDGKTLVRCKPEMYSGELAADDAKLPKVADILKLISEVKEWLPLPEFPACDKCNGAGKIVSDCSQCGGNGIYCGGECENCEEGKETNMCLECTTKFGQHEIQRQVYATIAALPGILWGDSGKRGALFFRWDGGDGAFMPLAKDGK